MLEAKLAGEEIARPEEPEPEAPVVDLLEALRLSVADVKKRKPASKAGAREKKATAGARRRAPARKSA
jgi:DNA end-binding protein Ku